MRFLPLILLIAATPAFADGMAQKPLPHTKEVKETQKPKKRKKTQSYHAEKKNIPPITQNLYTPVPAYSNHLYSPNPVKTVDGRSTPQYCFAGVYICPLTNTRLGITGSCSCTGADGGPVWGSSWQP